MNPLVEMAIRDAYFRKYGTQAATKLTSKQIEVAYEKAGLNSTANDVVAILEKRR